MTSPEILREASLRNVSVEVEIHRDDSTSVHARSRLLALTDDAMLIERPTIDDAHVSAPRGTSLVVRFVFRGERCFFRSFVRGQRRVRLNDNLGVRALVLEPPAWVDQTQRRRHYRVSIAADGTPVSCVAGDLGEPSPGALDPGEVDVSDFEAAVQLLARETGVRWEAQLINISISGMAVVTDAPRASLPRPGDTFRTTFTLCKAIGELDLIVRVRHVRALDEGTRHLIGVEFVQEADGGPIRQTADLVGRFVVQRQRRMLRRRK
jgi:c-di-GMP-binding flagellar brake protein YcgR